MNQENNKVTPDMNWGQYYDYLIQKGQFMKREYIKKTKLNDVFTWKEIEEMIDKLHEDLLYLKSWKKLEKDEKDI